MTTGAATLLLDLGAVALLTAIFHRLGGLKAEVTMIQDRIKRIRARVTTVEEEIET